MTRSQNSPKQHPQQKLKAYLYRSPTPAQPHWAINFVKYTKHEFSKSKHIAIFGKFDKPEKICYVPTPRERENGLFTHSHQRQKVTFARACFPKSPNPGSQPTEPTRPPNHLQIPALSEESHLNIPQSPNPGTRQRPQYYPKKRIKSKI